MVSLIRNGSRSLYITTKKMDSLIDFLKSKLNAQEMDIQVIQDRSREYQTVVFIADSSLDLNDKNTPVKAFLIQKEPVWVLSKLVTFNDNNIIEIGRASCRERV